MGGRLDYGKGLREKFPYSVECKNQEKVNVWNHILRQSKIAKTMNQWSLSNVTIINHLW